MSTSEPLAQLQWRRSSFTETGGSNGGTCVEFAALPDGRIAVRNSNHPDAGTALFTRPQIHTWLQGVKSGEFDDLT